MIEKKIHSYIINILPIIEKNLEQIKFNSVTISLINKANLLILEKIELK